MSYSDDDNCSVSSKLSTSSLSNGKILCNFCKEEITQKVIFNHLRKKHPDEFILNIDTKNLKEAIDSKTYYIMDLLVPDERDESECRFIKLYCIFGTDYKTNRGFLSPFRAEKYIKEKPTVVREHLSQMKGLLDIKLKDNTKKANLRGSPCNQVSLKLAYHFIEYASHPLSLLKHKEQDITDYEKERETIRNNFSTIVASLPTDPKRPLTDGQAKRIFEIKKSAERFFDGLANWVDRLYNYPPWVDTLYYTVCNEGSPEGRRYGENIKYFKTLTYPGDID